MENGLIIGISGKARVGKDTTADFLIKAFREKFNKEFIKIAYADGLKEKVMYDFDLTWDQLYGDLKEVPDKRYPKKVNESSNYEDGKVWKEEDLYWTPREILQFIGTDCYRAVDDYFWVKKLFKTIDENGYKNVIVSDCRFKSEIDPIKERGGHHVKVIRDYDGVVHNKTHQSETELEEDYKVDVKINNNSTLDFLEKTAFDTVDFIMALERSKSKFIKDIKEVYNNGNNNDRQWF